MPFNRVSLNLNMVFTHVPLIKRYELASKAGFKLVEVSIPYSEEANNLKKAADSYGLKHTLINAPPGDWGNGFRGLAALQSKRQEFRESIDKAIEYAKVLDCNKIHVMAGIPKEGDIDKSDIEYLENIKFAAEKLKKENIMCLIEPINHYTINGYFLHDFEQAMKIIRDIDLDNIKIQYDLFHAQQINGQITATMEKLRDYIGYLQVAQVPNRGPCDSEGEINYKYIFKRINDIGSDWIIGLEYIDEKGDFCWVKDMNVEF